MPECCITSVTLLSSAEELRERVSDGEVHAEAAPGSGQDGRERPFHRGGEEESHADVE